MCSEVMQLYVHSLMGNKDCVISSKFLQGTVHLNLISWLVNFEACELLEVCKMPKLEHHYQ